MKWIFNEKYLHLLDLLPSVFKNNDFFNQKKVFDDGPSDGSYNCTNNGLNDGLSNRR